MSELMAGDRVRVKEDAGFNCGFVGTVKSIEGAKALVLLDGNRGSTLLWNAHIELFHRPEQPAPSPAKHSHYFRPCPFDAIDVYRVLSIFGVVDPCLQHAVKKLLVAGGRGHKDISRDIQDSIDTLVRWQAMRAEEMA